MSYLDELPRCPHCDRILWTRNGAGWCTKCQRYVDPDTR